MFALHFTVMVGTIPTETIKRRDKRDKRAFCKKVRAVHKGRAKEGSNSRQLADKAGFIGHWFSGTRVFYSRKPAD